MSHIDWTFHVSDLLVVGGAFCTVITLVGRFIVKSVRHKVQKIDDKLDNHGGRIGTLEEARERHEAALKKLGFRTDHRGFIVRDVESL